MDLPFELFVALRYLLAKRKQAFISLISLISAVGVMVGVMAVLIALALMTGALIGPAEAGKKKKKPKKFTKAARDQMHQYNSKRLYFQGDF